MLEYKLNERWSGLRYLFIKKFTTLFGGLSHENKNVFTMNLLFAIIQGFWIIIPAYAANGFAPLARGWRRIDFGKELNGKEFLGAGKTWEGLLLALAAGTFFGFIEIISRPHLQPIALENGFSLQLLTIPAVFFIGLGAMLSDMLASFFKRRAGLERGESVPLLDQLDFLIGGFIAASFFFEVPPEAVVVIFIVTPAVHYIANLIGYELGWKEVPW